MILALIIIGGIVILRKRAENRRASVEMGQERLPARSFEKCPSMEMPGSACMARYGNVDPFIIQPMLGVYSSDEIIRESETVPRTLNVKRRDSIPILNPIYQRAVPLRGTKLSQMPSMVQKEEHLAFLRFLGRQRFSGCQQGN